LELAISMLQVLGVKIPVAFQNSSKKCPIYQRAIILARKYAEKFPNEFFEYMDIDKSGEKYLYWYNSILYSGFYLHDDFDKPEIVRENFAKTMKSNCKNCNETMNKRINKFALDCFPNLEK